MITGIITGFLTAMVIGALIFFLAGPKLLFKQSKSHLSFDDTVTRIEEQATGMGWKIPAVQDLQATLKKFDKDVRSVKVFEICHPDHSYKILSRSEERVVSSMMPCRIAVYLKDDESVWISRMNTGVVARPMSKVVRQTMSAAAKDVEKIIAEVTGE
ncbi:MAG: DUF302 domain-containing protein [Bacteroidota bacterium]